MLETVIAFASFLVYLAYARGQRPERSGFDLLLSPARLTDPATIEASLASIQQKASYISISSQYDTCTEP